MREILFRAKRVDNDEWVEGFYVVLQLVNYDRKEHLITDKDTAKSYEVDPATVGMFSGMYDKKGRRIFEGDIIRTITFGFDCEKFVTAIEYKYAQFRLQNGRNLFYFGQTDWTKMSDSEVIGNIHDNPNLLGGKDEDAG